MSGNFKGKSSSSWLAEGAKTSSMGTTETTAQVHPRLLTRALMDSAVERGAKLIKGACVVSENKN